MPPEPPTAPEAPPVPSAGVPPAPAEVAVLAVLDAVGDEELQAAVVPSTKRRVEARIRKSMAAAQSEDRARWVDAVPGRLAESAAISAITRRPSEIAAPSGDLAPLAFRVRSGAAGGALHLRLEPLVLPEDHDERFEPVLGKVARRAPVLKTGPSCRRP